MKTIKTFLAALLTLLFCACSGLPRSVSASYGGLGLASDQVPFMESVRTGTLPSGLRYFILENSRPENRAYLTLAVNAGSVLEEDDERGLAHFVEHMAFRGTERFPETELINYLRSLGMRFGPEVNAYTGFDMTVYGIEVPVEDNGNGIKQVPATALEVIDDWSRAITFSPEETDNERPVILEEYRTRLGSRERLQRQWVPVLFRGSPYADRLPIGRPEIIESAPASRLEGFYQKWYRADNMALIFAGDFDGAALESSLQEHFFIEKPAFPTQRPVFDLPLPKKGNIETLVLSDPELTGSRVSLYFKRSPEAPREDLSYYRNEIIDILIDRMLSLRFEDKRLNPQTPYISAGAGTAQYGASSRFYVMIANAKSGSTEESLLSLLETKEEMLRYGFTQAELDLAADSLLSDMQRMVMEKDRMESERYLNSLVSYYLEGGNYADIEWELNAMQQLLPRIKTRDINAAVKDYFAHNDLLVYISAPDSEQASLPDDARIKQLAAQSKKMKISPPKSSAVEEGFLASLPDRGAVTAESVDEETGAVIWQLSNGAKVILKETKNKNDEIVLQSLARGGTSSASPEDDISASLAVEMMQASGLGPWSRSELTRKLAGKQVSLSYSISSYNRSFRGSSTNGDLKTLFEMLHLNFTDPRIDPVAVEVMMEKYRSSLALRNENPQNVFSDEVNRISYGGHPHFKPLEIADLPMADISAALAFIRRSLNPADFTFVFTGNLETSLIKNYVETYLASIPAGEAWNAWTDLNIQRPGKIEKNVYKGKEEQSTVYLVWYDKEPFTDSLNAITQVLSEYLDIVLTDEIREKLGGVYSIGAGVVASPVPQGELVMQVIFKCSPKRVGELVNAVLAALQQVATGTIDQDIFNKSVEALKKEWEISMQSNSTIALSYANSSVLLDLPLSRLHRRPQFFSAVTRADIQRICARLLQRGPAQIVLFPETEG